MQAPKHKGLQPAGFSGPAALYLAKFQGKAPVHIALGAYIGSFLPKAKQCF